MASSPVKNIGCVFFFPCPPFLQFSPADCCFTAVFAQQTLSLQRQMMENLVVAKAREEAVSFLALAVVKEELPQLSSARM